MRAVGAGKPAVWSLALQVELGVHRATFAPEQRHTTWDSCVGDEVRNDDEKVSPRSGRVNDRQYMAVAPRSAAVTAIPGGTATCRLGGVPNTTLVSGRTISVCPPTFFGRRMRRSPRVIPIRLSP
jgi:hypothetical protein